MLSDTDEIFPFFDLFFVSPRLRPLSVGSRTLTAPPLSELFWLLSGSCGLDL